MPTCMGSSEEARCPSQGGEACKEQPSPRNSSVGAHSRLLAAWRPLSKGRGWMEMPLPPWVMIQPI